ncbi:uncharacterized protein LTR77_005330 [Saxophila tyrrhenica]|uniref:ferric-chelate reductase (NADPH) n=1 Tax=Saxophila tyrrhenica TaxID=1690608 RepID=A0AAV9PCC4_9PEZI|nr:hypothetical protein LTR77_005330 [Saxophila tyrrhenica]
MPIPWLGGPMSLHAWREYMCMLDDKSQCEYQQGYWRFWSEADHRYAVPTTAFFTACILVFAVGNFFNNFMSRSLAQNRTVRRKTALYRYLSYRSFRIPALNWNSAPLGVLALGAIGTIYFMCMTLAPKPFYWPNTDKVDYGSSPPLATRSGWLSLGCMPFVFATAGKSNFISAVTGVSHEKLQVFHRWISYAFFITALLHTFPFIVYNFKTGTMKESWNTSVFYWTGVVALIAQGWLTFASFGPFRKWSYEFFKFSHFLAALIFMLFLFFHCDYTLSSWDYFIATGILFSLSWLHRQTRVYFEHGINKRATISLSTNGFICVKVPTHSTWAVGQHFFVRFMGLGMHAWTIHPFTACSLPERASVYERTESELVFYIRPQGGFTARLARWAEAYPNGSMRVLIDGPYGGFDMRKLQQSRQQLIIAGGSGAGWIIPVLTAYLRQRQLEPVGEKDAVSTSARVVLATRDLATRQWFEETLHQLLSTFDMDTLPKDIEVELYYTGSSANAEAPKLTGQFLQKLDEPEKALDIAISPRHGSDSDATSSSMDTQQIRHIDARPDLPALVRSEVASASSTDQLGVFVCGPLSMQNDVSQAVAAEQLGIVRSGGKDVYLHMEHFSWA